MPRLTREKIHEIIHRGMTYTVTSGRQINMDQIADDILVALYGKSRGRRGRLHEDPTQS